MWGRIRKVGQSFADGVRQQPMVTVLSLALSSLTLLGATSLSAYLRDRDIQVGEDHARNLSYVLAQQEDRSFRSIDNVISGLVLQLDAAKDLGDLRRLSVGSDFQRTMRERVAGLMDIDNIAIVDADGRLLNRTRGGSLPLVDLSKRDYIGNLRSAPAGSLYVSVPVPSPTTGSWEVALAERLTASDGAFLGVVIGVVELHSIERNFSAITLGPHGSISLDRKDGIHLARFPHVNSLIGSSLAGT
jgi:hypothetical protein